MVRQPRRAGEGVERHQAAADFEDVGWIVQGKVWVETASCVQ
jgi:hypothetical protein